MKQHFPKYSKNLILVVRVSIPNYLDVTSV